MVTKNKLLTRITNFISISTLCFGLHTEIRNKEKKGSKFPSELSQIGRKTDNYSPKYSKTFSF